MDRLKEKERRARFAGSEVDAALNDPRWLALRALASKGTSRLEGPPPTSA